MPDANQHADLTPIPASEVFKDEPDVEGSVRIVFLGEDADTAMTPGHRIPADEFLTALRTQRPDLADLCTCGVVEREWAIITRHQPPDWFGDPNYDGECPCEDWGRGHGRWWCSFVDTTAGVPAGAIAVTRWSYAA